MAVLIWGILWWRGLTQHTIRKALKEVKSPAADSPNLYQYILIIEKKIYLFVYFLADTIAMFEILNLLAVGVVNHSIFPLKTFAFFLSVCYAAWIHIYCRLDDFEENYNKLNILAAKLPFKLPKEQVIATISAYARLFCALYLSHNPWVFTISLLSAIAISLCYYKQIFSAHYGIYLHFFAYNKFKKFSILLVEQMRIFTPYASPSYVTSYLNIVFNFVAFLYAIVSCSSQLRYQQIVEQLPDEQAPEKLSWLSIPRSPPPSPEPVGQHPT